MKSDSIGFGVFSYVLNLLDACVFVQCDLHLVEQVIWVNVHLFTDVGSSLYVVREDDPSAIKIQGSVYC